MKTQSELSPELSRYIAQVQEVPRLSREEEHELAIRAQTGDEAARAKLIEANLRYVVAIALKYRRYGMRVGDLISEGNVGLMTALKKFDPSRGTRFVTYAAHWIRALILEHVIKAWSLVGVGAGPLRSKVFFRLRREKAKILAGTSDTAEANERLAEQFGTTAEKIVLLGQRLEARDMSIDAPVRGDDGRAFVEMMASPEPSQEELLSSAERSARLDKRVREAIVDLDPRERYIVQTRMMADGPDELSLAEIGRRLGVSRERARQLEARAKAKLKKSLQPAATELSYINKAA
jgi:RNA polymerase sigma-32 factor